MSYLTKFHIFLLTAFLSAYTLHSQIKSGNAADYIIVKGRVIGDIGRYNKVYVYGRAVKDDSVIINNGSFELKIPYHAEMLPVFYAEYDVKVSGKYRPFPLLVEGPGVVHLMVADINEGLGSGKWKGMRSAEDYQALDSQILAIQMNAMKTNVSGSSSINSKMPAIFETFIKNDPDSYAATFALNSQVTAFSINDLDRIYKMLSGKRQQSKVGQEIAAYISGMKGFSVGNYVEDFTLKTPDDQEIRFSSFKGKYVLIDFWASWCGPCKESFPGLKELYKKYKNSGFEIYSISIDREKQDWLRESKIQQLPWLNALDTKNISKRIFAVTGVPSTYLVDPNGKILLKEVSFEPGNASPLGKKLFEVFGR